MKTINPAPTLPVEFAHGHDSIWNFRGIRQPIAGSTS